MPENVHIGLLVVSALGAGLVGGVFFAFSTFIMNGLSRLPAGQSTAAMQAINVAAPNPWFMTPLFGTALTATIVAIASLHRRGELDGGLVIVGAAVYLVGVVAVTIAGNVPLNDGLAQIDPGSADAASRWEQYQSSWTVWNSVRAATSLAAATAFTLALVVG